MCATWTPSHTFASSSSSCKVTTDSTTVTDFVREERICADSSEWQQLVLDMQVSRSEVSQLRYNASVFRTDGFCIGAWEFGFRGGGVGGWGG